MKQYRIVTALTARGTPHFAVQKKGWFGIWYAVYPSWEGRREHFYRQEYAEEYLHELALADKRKLELKKKKKEFKPKVVYGPYP